MVINAKVDEILANKQQAHNGIIQNNGMPPILLFTLLLCLMMRYGLYECEDYDPDCRGNDIVCSFESEISL